MQHNQEEPGSRVQLFIFGIVDANSVQCLAGGFENNVLHKAADLPGLRKLSSLMHTELVFGDPLFSSPYDLCMGLLT